MGKDLSSEYIADGIYWFIGIYCRKYWMLCMLGYWTILEPKLDIAIL